MIQMSELNQPKTKAGISNDALRDNRPSIVEYGPQKLFLQETTPRLQGAESE